MSPHHTLFPPPPSPKSFLNILKTICYEVDKNRSESWFQINISQVQIFLAILNRPVWVGSHQPAPNGVLQKS
jgi:hypothetical protein